MIVFVCPGCRKNFKLQDEFAGRSTSCPTCKTPFVVPHPPAIAALVAAGSPSASSTGTKWHSGDRVLAHWPKEVSWWYAGRVLEVTAEHLHVEFDDGDQSWLLYDQVTCIDIKEGSSVQGRWKQGAIFFDGVITAINGEQLHIHYADGDKEWTTIRWIRVDRGAPTSSTTAQRAKNREHENAGAISRRPMNPSNPLNIWGIILVAAWALISLLGVLVIEEAVIAFLLFVGTGIGVTVFLWWLAGTQCPKCKALWGKQHLRSSLTDSSDGYETVTRQQKDTQGRVISSWEEQVHVVRENYLDFYKCSNCGHEWTGISARQYEG